MVQLCRVIARWSSIGLTLFSISLLNGCAHSLSKQISSGSVQACQANALLQRYHCSLKEVEAAATNNDADAEYALGYMYYYGIDAAENVEIAKLWMRRAAAQGQPQAIEALRILQVSAVEEKLTSHQPTKPLAPVQQKPKSQAAPPRSASVKSTLAVVAQPAVPSAASSTQNNLQASYSIQLAASVDLPRLKEYVVMHHLKGKAGYYRACIKGKAWYVLIYGHYANKSEALQALRMLPANLKEQAPWIKSYKTIQAQVADGNKC